LENDYEEYFVDGVDYFDKSIFAKITSVKRFVYSKEAKNKLEQLIQKEKPDIAHLHIFYGRLTLSILPVLKKYKIPAVMTLHEYKLLCPVYNMLDNKGNICEKCANGSYYHCIIRKCNRNNLSYSFVAALECYIRDYFFAYEKFIAKFIAVSKFVANKHLQYKTNLKDKIDTIYNFINFKDIIPSYSTGDYYLYFGRLSMEKGILTLLNAWRNFPDLKLKIVGDGTLKEEIIRYIQENNMHHAELLGYRTGEVLNDIIQNAHFIISPSECYETFGLSIVESFALGRPVIASNIGAFPELVQNQINGFLFESKDVHSLVKAVNLAEALSEGQYIEMSKNARKFAERNFNSHDHYLKLMDVYKEAVS